MAMRGVAVDCTNKPPTWRSVRLAKLDAIRIEMRDLLSFYKYTSTMDLHQTVKQVWLVGPSTGDVERILATTTVKPSLVIIGNEPDIEGDSSWTMTEAEYVQLYNKTALLVRTRWQDNPPQLATAGMYHQSYAWAVRPYLIPTPNYLNMHYPKGIDAFKEFSRGTPCIVGEWTWRNASQAEMNDWVRHFLNYYSWHWFWFCWADYMVPGHGLLNSYGKPTQAYRRLKNALRAP